MGSLVLSLDLIATFAFAVVGARVAINRGMDYGGIVLIALIASISGGTLRNLFLGETPSWLTQPEYLLAVIVAVIFALVAPAKKPIGLFILSLDTFGLGVAVVSGTQFALEKEASFYSAILLGVITGVTGGLLRDVLCQVEPILLHRETIGTSSVLGAGAYVFLDWLNLATAISALTAGAFVIIVRAVSIKFDLHLPRAK
jgi:uncharacterized membrane protein YeiH